MYVLYVVVIEFKGKWGFEEMELKLEVWNLIDFCIRSYKI